MLSIIIIIIIIIITIMFIITIIIVSFTYWQKVPFLQQYHTLSNTEPWTDAIIDTVHRRVDLYILACVMSPEFTREAVMKFLPAPFSWIWCKCLLRNLIHSKIFNLTNYREVLVKYSLLITHAEMLLWIWHQLQKRLTDSFFK